jgi:hypothetical protein
MYEPDFIAKKPAEKEPLSAGFIFIEIRLRRSTYMKNPTHIQPINFQDYDKNKL